LKALSLPTSSCDGIERSRSAEEQSQRDCILQPRVARNELPWEKRSIGFNSNGVASWRLKCTASHPFQGCLVLRSVPRVARGLATLGFEAEFLRNSIGECG
jgi:hypothetical protein